MKCPNCKQGKLIKFIYTDSGVEFDGQKCSKCCGYWC